MTPSPKLLKRPAPLWPLAIAAALGTAIQGANVFFAHAQLEMQSTGETALTDSALYTTLDALPAWIWNLATEAVLFVTAYYICEGLRRSGGGVRLARSLYLGASTLTLVLSPVTAALSGSDEPSVILTALSGLLVIVTVTMNIAQIITGCFIAKTYSRRCALFGLWLILLPSLANVGTVLYNLNLQSADWLSYGIYLTAFCLTALPFLLIAAMSGRAEGRLPRRWIFIGLTALLLGAATAASIHTPQPENDLPAEAPIVADEVSPFEVNSGDSTVNINAETDTDSEEWEDI